MSTISIRLTLILLVVAFSAAAQGQEDDWYVVPSIIWFDDDADRALDDSFPGAQVTVGRNLTEYLSLEGLLGYSSIKGHCEPGDCYPDQTHLDISANLLAFYDRDSVFAPYLLVGVGYLGEDAEDGLPFIKDTGGDNNPTGSVGLGFKWRMGQSNFSIRGEHRVRVAFDTNNFTDQLTTIGVQYSFGGSNRNQRLSVRAEDIKTDTDDDEDRINNSVDQCPNTPIGVPVDPRGCSLDSDMDGVTTDKDRCPASRPGADVNSYGCESDEDNDGVLDQYDECPNTPAGARTDVKGCEIKDVISLPGVNFETGQDVLLPGTEYLLKTAADTLNKHPELQIEVAGHSDDVGNADQNIGLSMRRARTVQDFLIQYGVDEDRLTFRGYGEAQPIADNSTAEGRATNRRVELRLVTR